MKNRKFVVTAALLAGLLAPGVLQAQPEDEGDAPAAQPARSTTVRLNGTVGAMDVGKNALTVKDIKGAESTVTLLPTTNYYEREVRLKAADLAVGNVVDTPLIAKTMLTVTSLAPLTFQVGDIGVFTVNKPESLVFNRYVTIKREALAVGTRVQGEATAQVRGMTEASVIYVIVTKRRATK